MELLGWILSFKTYSLIVGGSRRHTFAMVVINKFAFGFSTSLKSSDCSSVWSDLTVGTAVTKLRNINVIRVIRLQGGKDQRVTLKAGLMDNRIRAAIRIV